MNLNSLTNSVEESNNPSEKETESEEPIKSAFISSGMTLASLAAAVDGIDVPRSEAPSERVITHELKMVAKSEEQIQNEETFKQTFSHAINHQGNKISNALFSGAFGYKDQQQGKLLRNWMDHVSAKDPNGLSRTQEKKKARLKFKKPKTKPSPLLAKLIGDKK